MDPVLWIPRFLHLLSSLHSPIPSASQSSPSPSYFLPLLFRTAMLLRSQKRLGQHYRAPPLPATFPIPSSRQMSNGQPIYVGSPDHRPKCCVQSYDITK